jgi:hypothetical protein
MRDYDVSFSLPLTLLIYHPSVVVHHICLTLQHMRTSGFSVAAILDNHSLVGTTRELRWISSYFSRMLAQPQEGNEVVLHMGLWIYLIALSNGQMEWLQFCSLLC